MFIENKGAVAAALEAAGISLPESFNVDAGVVTRVEEEQKALGKDPEAAYLLAVVDAAKHVAEGIALRQKEAADAAAAAEAAQAPVSQADGEAAEEDEPEKVDPEEETEVVQ